MPSVVRMAGQAVTYVAFAAFIGYFSMAPPYTVLEPRHGLLRLSFTHPGKVVSACRQRSAEELAKLPPQMRSTEECQRARSPVQVRIEVDGRVMLERSFPPAGLAKDGASSGYWRTPIATGSHELRVQVRDDVRPEAPAYQRSERIDVREGAIVLVDFKPELGGVTIR